MHKGSAGVMYHCCQPRCGSCLAHAAPSASQNGPCPVSGMSRVGTRSIRAGVPIACLGCRWRPEPMVRDVDSSEMMYVCVIMDGE
jgi:hypothetical protein